MEDPNDLKLILNFKTYSIPSDLGSMSSINPEIYSTLMTKKKYEVKSDVSEKTFQFFIKYLVRRDIPPISLYNFQEYELLRIRHNERDNSNIQKEHLKIKPRFTCLSTESKIKCSIL